MDSGSDRVDMSLDELLADIKEKSKKYDADGSTPSKEWSTSDIDSLLGMDDILSGFSDYDSAGEDELIYVPETSPEAEVEPEPEETPETIDGSPVVEVQFGADAFDDPKVSERYAQDGIFEDYVREVRRKKTRSVSPVEDDGATPEPTHVNPFSVASPEQDDGNSFTKVLDSEEAPERIAPAPKLDFTAGIDEAAIMQGKTIVARDIGSTDKRKPPVGVNEDDEEVVDGQIVFSGFDEDDAPEKVDEAQVEELLSEKRSEKARDFKLYDFAKKYEPDLPGQFDDEDSYDDDDDAPGETDEDESDGAFEYRHFSQRSKISRRLAEERRGAFFTTVILALIDVVLIVLSVLAGGSAAESRDILYAVSVLLLSVASAVSISSLISGFKALLKLKPNCDTSAALVMVVTLVHAMVAFAFPDSTGISGVYCAAAVFALTLNQASHLCSAGNAVENFRFCSTTYADRLYSIRGFDTQRDNLEIGKNLMLGDPELRYSCKTRFPSGFIKNSGRLTSVDRICRLIFPGGLVAGLILAAAGWIKTKAALGALTGFTGALCITLPVGAALSVTLPMLLATKRLNSAGAMIASPDAASSCGRTNAVVLDAVDLYDRDQCNVFGFKDYKTVRIDDVLLYAAAMVIESGGPLTAAFEKIVGSRNILPPVKSLNYEDKLGLSAWIHNQKVLLGNRNLLINHSIEAPPKSEEMKYLASGKRVLYMSIESRVAIMFVVGYMEKNELAPYIHSIHGDGINILVSSSDCNITEDFINEGFGIVSGGVKVMNSSSSTIFHENRMREKNSASCAVMHDGRAESFLRCIAATVTLNNISRVAALLQVAGSALGALMLFVMLLISGASGAGFLTVLIFTALWSAVSVCLGAVQSVKKI